MTPKEFLEFARKHGARMMDLKSVDMLGVWQHGSYPIETIDESVFKELGFDGSSIRASRWTGTSVSSRVPGGFESVGGFGCTSLCSWHWVVGEACLPPVDSAGEKPNGVSLTPVSREPGAWERPTLPGSFKPRTPGRFPWNWQVDMDGTQA